MVLIDLIRAWKDVDYRLSLDPQQRAIVPSHPAGDIEFLEVALEEDPIYVPTASMDEASCT